MANIVLLLHILSPITFGFCLGFDATKPIALALGGVFVLCQLAGRGMCWLTIFENQLRGFAPRRFSVIGIAFLVQHRWIKPPLAPRWIRNYTVVITVLVIAASCLPPLFVHIYR